ncbi:hypothetical protein Henu3_gp11 [Mycobacterium phage Henu3]|uniref:Uncharacterized protein n=1 Tax=Mycobacterium phage Henu3 TaxID=2492961 RepID=A0A410T7I9_9CAUD|nr:hypothetical protein I5G68_gp09 [Mycobacterium phage Henu3]QAU04954.1 hypothetical protein Henu3_gp11 [Mycobacterium phage Henu3]
MAAVRFIASARLVSASASTGSPASSAARASASSRSTAASALLAVRIRSASRSSAVRSRPRMRFSITVSRLIAASCSGVRFMAGLLSLGGRITWTDGRPARRGPGCTRRGGARIPRRKAFPRKPCGRTFRSPVSRWWLVCRAVYTFV